MKRFVCFHLCLAFVGVTLAVAGCGGTPLISIGVSVQNADKAFDEAQAFRIQADEDTERDKRRVEVEQKKTLYNDALKAYRAIVKAEPTGKYAQRSLWQISEIYRRRYEWGRVIKSYEAILAIAPSGYYGDRAKSGIAHIRTYRRLSQEERRKYQNYSALYAQDNAGENYDLAAQALYDVADSYEQLADYPEAIAHYQRVVDEFPDYQKASVALTKIGDIHFYKLYDYPAGWPVYNKVIEMYPDSYDAFRSVQLLKETRRDLDRISQYQAEIDRYWNERTMEYQVTNRKTLPNNKRYSHRRIVSTVELVVQNYRIIAGYWLDLRNFPSAIIASRNSIIAYEAWPGQRSNGTHAVVQAHYLHGRAYHSNGQLEQAIGAYQGLLDHCPEPLWPHNAVFYLQADCYREIREFTKAYEGFKAYLSLGRDVDYYQEVEEIVRQFEIDEDGDGYKFYIEQEAGTSDRDPNDYPNVKS